MDDIKETTVTEEKKEIVEQYKKLLFIVNPKAGQNKREDILVDVINIFNDWIFNKLYSTQNYYRKIYSNKEFYYCYGIIYGAIIYVSDNESGA